MALDNMGRVFLTNDPDISMFRDHMDKNHYYAGDRRTFALATLIVFTFLSTITTILRIYTRTRIIKAFGSDDWVMMIAQLGFFHYLGFQFAEVVYGTGLRRDQLTIENAEMGLKYWYFCAISYSLVTVFVKVTIGLFLLRFTTHKIQNILIWVINIACCIVGLGYFIFLLLTCHPFDFYWNLDPAATGHCFTAQTWLNVGYFVAACNVGADAIFAVIPMFIVWGTTMNSKTKFGVCILLGMGSVAVVGTIIRTIYGHTFGEYKHEFLFETCLIAILSTIELGLGITAANVATFRPLFRKWKSHLPTTQQRQYDPTSSISRQANIRWVVPFKFGDDAAAGQRPAFSEAISPNESQKTMKTMVTGRESIGGMPDLVFAQIGDEEKGELLFRTVPDDNFI
ncbi:hypothetical protein C1H76_0130 [Elsinoe australis]|uniref:Rhodopsin domain-containing protein n=1 Tax=Elsinoe australis TaxID=40998 RepID=A0A4U7B859_9PEZI|nr:hypothetical protein C1H76_0130 [Elsinoe australis]